jgi:hypothetical protein
MTLIYVTCDQQFESIPVTAVKLTKRKGSGASTYLFDDGTIHNLRKQKLGFSSAVAHGAHLRWHLRRNINKPDCTFCNPALAAKE